MSLRVASVKVTNVLGIQEAALQPDGRAVLVSGRNASGKTSLIQAIQTALTGGNLAKLSRVGSEDDPEVVLVLEGEGSESYLIEKKGSKTARVRSRVGDSQAFEDVPKPQQWLTSLFDPKACNPVAFLTAPAKDRAPMLLEALPLEMDREQLNCILGAYRSHVGPIPAKLHPLEELAMIRAAIFSTRTGVNRDKDSALKTADQTRRGLPAVPPQKPEGLDELARRIEEQATSIAQDREVAQAQRDQADARIRAEHKESVRKLRADQDKRAADLRAEVERQIAAEAEAVEEEVERLRDGNQAEIARAILEHEASLRRFDERAEGLAQDRVALAEMRTQGEAAVKAQTLVDLAAEKDREAEQHKALSDELTATLDQLDAFGRQLASDLPIEGLEIDGKEIRVYGVPYDQLNHAQRVEIAAKVAMLRARENPLRVVFLDGLESLDSAHREALMDLLVREGVQPFGAVVTDEEQDVEFFGAVTQEALSA